MFRSRVLATFFTLLVVSSTEAAVSRTNILWIIVDDMSANFSCYGEELIETPNVDHLAKQGVKFTNAYVTAPVCSTCRSAFITGMYQTSIGAHHHRSGRGKKKIRLPSGIKPVPVLFQEAGYHTSIGSWPPRKNRLGKTDYNFEWDESMYDSADWSDRKSGQPFFHQIQMSGGKMRGGNRAGAQKLAARARQEFGNATSTDDVRLPPYYPRDEVIVEDWAAYLDSVRFTDLYVGQILKRLRKEGVLEETLVIFMTDHGISHARGKQFLYDEGIHVPLVIRGPGLDAGSVRKDLVEHIDIAALSLAAAGIPLPSYMQARDILAKNYEARNAIFAARDRCDETVEHLRCVRTHRYKYIRNFLPDRPYLQPNAYKDKKSILIALRAAHAAGKLNDAQSLILAETRPHEELYDLEADPHEINNLAADPKHGETLAELRARLDRWMEETNDHGRQPETVEMYDSDMAVYLNTLKNRKRDPADLKRIEDNIALMKKWASEGK